MLTGFHLRRVSELALRAMAFVAATATCLLCAAMTMSFGAAAVTHIRAGGAPPALGLSAVTLFLGLATLVFAKTAGSALLWAPAMSRRDDRQPPPELLGVPARLGPRGPSPLAAHAAVDLSENE